jgi:hypothetical protein
MLGVILPNRDIIDCDTDSLLLLMPLCDDLGRGDSKGNELGLLLGDFNDDGDDGVYGLYG